MKSKVVAVVGVVLSGAVPYHQAFAKSEPYLCAEIFPCDAEGKLLPEFSEASSPCYEGYRLECEQFLESLAERQSLELEMGRLQIENVKLRDENRRLRRLVRIRR